MTAAHSTWNRPTRIAAVELLGDRFRIGGDPTPMRLLGMIEPRYAIEPSVRCIDRRVATVGSSIAGQKLCFHISKKGTVKREQSEALARYEGSQGEHSRDTNLYESA